MLIGRALQGAYQSRSNPEHRVRQGCALSPTLFNYKIDWILGQAPKDYPGVQAGANAHVSDLAYGGDIAIPGSSYSEMQGLCEADNRHAPQ